MNKPNIYKIKDIEKILRVNRKTLCYWEKVGKIPKARRERMSNYRYWTSVDLRALKLIVTGKS